MSRFRVFCGALALVAGVGSPPLFAQPVALVGHRFLDGRVLEDAVQGALNSGYHHSSPSPDKLRRIRKEQFDRLIQRELDFLGALDQGMTASVAAGERHRQEVERALGRDAYEGQLAVFGWDRAAHARLFSEILLGEEAHRCYVIEPAQVSAKEIREAFEASPERFRLPETLNLRYILVKVDESEPPGRWGEREAEARALIDRLRKGEDFAEVAFQNSDNDYRVKGGDLGWVHHGRLMEPLESAVWAASEGDLLGPLRSTEGFHIAKVVARRGERQLSLTEAEPGLRRQLEAKKLRDVEEAWYVALRQRYPVEILDSDLDIGGE